MRALIILGLGLAVAFDSTSAGRIVGGDVTSISNYPFAVVMLHSPRGNGDFVHTCGGSIVNNRAIVSAAHCFRDRRVDRWRARAGSTYTNKGGQVVSINRFIIHPLYGIIFVVDSDIAIVRINGAFSFNDNLKNGLIAGPNYVAPDNAPVRLVGWGDTQLGGPSSVELRHVQVWVINQEVCKVRFQETGDIVTRNMICSGHLDVGGRDACHGDSGGPLMHNNIIVGIISWGHFCDIPRFPRVAVRVSRFSSWIEKNA